MGCNKPLKLIKVVTRLNLNRLIHSKMKILSIFTHHVCLTFLGRTYFEECWKFKQNKTLLTFTEWKNKNKTLRHSSKYLILCFTKSYRFRTRVDKGELINVSHFG